jgi:phosphatidylglycerophosphate synthase
MNQTPVIQFIEPFKTIPNQLTGIRFLLIPILWVFALMRVPFYIGIGLIIATVTDALDGHMARRLNLVSEFGGKFDSLTDLTLTLSAIAWLFMLRPEIFAENSTVFIIAMIIYVVALLLGWAKFGPLANLDLWSSKAAGLMEYIFIIHAFLFDQYSQILFNIAVGMSILSCTETIVLRLTQSGANERTGSVVLSFLGKTRRAG